MKSVLLIFTLLSVSVLYRVLVQVRPLPSRVYEQRIAGFINESTVGLLSERINKTSLLDKKMYNKYKDNPKPEIK
jgi:hypothetical protein